MNSISAETFDKIRKAMALGMSTREAAEFAGCNRNTVYTWFHKLGKTPEDVKAQDKIKHARNRRPREPRAPPPEWKPTSYNMKIGIETYNKVRDGYIEGWGANALAARLGIKHRIPQNYFFLWQEIEAMRKLDERP